MVPFKTTSDGTFQNHLSAGREIWCSFQGSISLKSKLYRLLIIGASQKQGQIWPKKIYALKVYKNV